MISFSGGSTPAFYNIDTLTKTCWLPTTLACSIIASEIASETSAIGGPLTLLPLCSWRLWHTGSELALVGRIAL